MSHASGTCRVDTAYWEARAERFAGAGDGLRAVCSYGMPGFYNRAIHRTQLRALAPWLRVRPGTSMLDVGCGIGRWSRIAARRGASVVGIDLSGSMIDEARTRSRDEGLEDRCTFDVADIAELSLDRTFDLIVCVTVLQHIVDGTRRRRAVDRIKEHLRPGGRAVVLEAAPKRRFRKTDHAQFAPWTLGEHLDLFREAGLEVEGIAGVDACLPRKWVLPIYGRVPKPVGVALLGAATAATHPYELLFARWVPRWAWHQLFVLGRR